MALLNNYQNKIIVGSLINTAKHFINKMIKYDRTHIKFDSDDSCLVFSIDRTGKSFNRLVIRDELNLNFWFHFTFVFDRNELIVGSIHEGPLAIEIDYNQLSTNINQLINVFNTLNDYFNELESEY